MVLVKYLTQHLRPPQLEPRILMAMKLKGMKEIEKTSVHMEIIRLLTPKSSLVRDAMGMNATWHIQLTMKQRVCEVRSTHLE